MQVQSVESNIINCFNELIQDLATFAMNMGTQALFEIKLKEHAARLEQAVNEYRLDRNVEIFNQKVRDSVAILQKSIA